MVKFSAYTAFIIMLLTLSTSSFAANVIFLDEQFEGSSMKFRADLKAAIKAAGFDLVETKGMELASVLSKEQGPGSILVLPDGRYLPADAKKDLQEFLKRGNHFVAASGPAFVNMIVRKYGKWLTKDDAKADLANVDGETITDFAQEDITKWTRYPMDPNQKASIVVEKSGNPKVPDALHVAISKLSGWEMYGGPEIRALSPGWKATVFWAKGGHETPELSVEWREKDGSRWMTVIKLSPEWKEYVLFPSDFKYWSDKPVPGRGGSKDAFNPDNASHMAFGLANGITSQKQDVPHEYWLAGIRAAKNIYADVDFSQPVFESISPVTKTYRTMAVSVQRVSTGAETPLNEEIISPVPRARGLALAGERKYRYIPILRAMGKDGSYRSSAAHMFLNLSGDYAKSVWGFVGFNQPYLQRKSATAVPLIVSMLKRIEAGVFLGYAGTEHFAYTDGETVKTGAYVSNLNVREIPAKVDFTILKDDKVIKQGSVAGEGSKLFEGPSYKFGPGEYTIKAVLSVDGRTLDSITHDFRVLKFNGQDRKSAVSVDNDEFKLDGKPWRPLGVNYWPVYSVAQEPDDLGLRWFASGQYDPAAVEQDFSLIGKLGMNSISILYMQKSDARCLMDVLARAEHYGLKVNVYLPGLHPLEQDLGKARSMIEAAHLPESPAVFAYDCGWEVHVGNYDRRKNYEGEWQQWVIERYGSIEAAQNDWGYTPPLRNDRITGPSDEQLKNDGRWRIYVAAYRRFWDDEISRRYREVRDFIRSIDNYHLIGARSGYGGCGSLWIADRFPFDLASGAKHLDFISPEAYGSQDNPSSLLESGITTLYAQLVSGGKPVFWAEFGSTIWPKCDSYAIEMQRQTYQYLLKAALDTNSRGAMAWWWPGGFRPGEESDFGIINPDGTPRPAVLEISKASARFKQPSKQVKPDAFITIDRDKHVSGYAGIYGTHAPEYMKAVSSGKTPALRTEGAGTTSADTPLVAVGNTPYNGQNPPKYLNAEFDYIMINGKPVKDGDTVEVERGKPVYVEASIVNTAEAKWLAPKGDEAGAVYLLIESDGQKMLAPIAADTPFLSDASVARFELSKGLESEKVYTFRMTSKGRAEFGDVVRVTVRVK